jgi:FAD/FMN-containing dehydrogenase
LFLGAEGTLGVITAAVLKLHPRPRDIRAAYCAIRDVDAAVELLTRARDASGDRVETFELVPRTLVDLVLETIPDCQDPMSSRHEQHVLLELISARPDDASLDQLIEDILGQAMEDGLVLDAVICQNEAQRQNLWKIRENAAEAQKVEGASVKHDISVPVSRIAEFYSRAHRAALEIEPNLRLIGFGHVGDGNLHYNMQQPKGADGDAFLAKKTAINRAVHDVVVEMNGSISAEHGIGRLKRDELAHYKSPVELKLMHQLKRAIDPNGIMNPGVLL